MRQASLAGGLGGGSPQVPSGWRGARGAEPARSLIEQIRPIGEREGRACSQKKGNKASTQVVIRDLFCKRRRAMLQYGTPDWARPCLARLTPWGFCVGTAGSETH